MSDDARGEMLIRREEAKFERAKAKAEASAETMKNTLASLLKQETVKKTLAKDAMKATKDPSRREDILDRAGGGTYDNDREVITGDEPRPWED